MVDASKDLDIQGASPTADRILFLIKSRGPTSTARLALALDLTPEAARPASAPAGAPLRA